jgi:hypothetical protein
MFSQVMTMVTVTSTRQALECVAAAKLAKAKWAETLLAASGLHVEFERFFTRNRPMRRKINILRPGSNEKSALE